VSGPFVHHPQKPADGSAVRRLDLGFFVRPASETGTGAARVEPAYGYLVSSPELTICFDTGIGAADAETEAHYQPVRHSLSEALAAAGASAEDVDLIVNSHLHFDHCGGNAELHGRPIIVQTAELEAARQSGYTVPELVDFPGAVYRELEGEAELADGVIVLPTPGHSPGHQSLVVLCRDGTVVVAGQATDYAFEYGSHHLAGVASIAMGHTVAPRPAWMERLERFDPRRVVFAHDGAVWEPA
jgi:N-acyl homoserine lactone hydrolase